MSAITPLEARGKTVQTIKLRSGDALGEPDKVEILFTDGDFLLLKPVALDSTAETLTTVTVPEGIQLSIMQEK